MRLDPEAREVVNKAHADAHAKGGTTRCISARFVKSIRDLERFGHPWVADYLDDLLTVGAMKDCADWRRKHQVTARNKSGAVDLPAYVGRTNDNGEAVQAPLTGLDLDAIVAHRSRLNTTRNTLSREVAALDALIELMLERPDLVTVGDALEVLMGTAA